MFLLALGSVDYMSDIIFDIAIMKSHVIVGGGSAEM
jgi:hypothetical protein